MLLQTQSDVGVFGGIAGGIINGDLRKRNLLGAFAGNIAVGDGLVTQIIQRHRIHVMPCAAGIEHE